MSVSTFIGLAPGYDPGLGLVSLDPKLPQVETFEKDSPEKWSVAKLPKEILCH